MNIEGGEGELVMIKDRIGIMGEYQMWLKRKERRECVCGVRDSG